MCRPLYYYHGPICPCVNCIKFLNFDRKKYIPKMAGLLRNLWQQQTFEFKLCELCVIWNHLQPSHRLTNQVIDFDALFLFFQKAEE